ncbi:AraC family transcriptional regulator [Bacillus canaveralius]|uniref:AraC family transcriptional regulator n=1 Tax=Bacillus canaveralius TaxID=1403243 RepID=A0A2N5GKR7_9BACI|nr:MULTISPECIES: helix-turn-helix domain-containing protein [Bacillus]PLR82096.1 AraC family transcriptional regulator [Bacillus canaveralius]PLR83924.1 AraC family transcriptional regulator [Bacillus sp. V33-4]PLR97998.1 AraC family transcriptional regulator [Bacillus canaveralius]
MVKLLIADRDHNERTGIGWLVSSYSIPFDHVLAAGSISKLFDLFEAELPDVICIELDMISKDRWDRFKELVKRYRTKVIVMTAEATFERALQGIELHAFDLWLKPHSPDHIKRVLSLCCKDVSQAKKKQDPSAQSEESSISYRSLFVHQETLDVNYRLMLMQLENPKKLPILLSFLQEYYFHYPPVLLPLSDMIVLVFSCDHISPLEYLKQISNRILIEWEERFSEPISLVLYDSHDPFLSLNEQYRRAKQGLEIRFFKGYRQLSVIEDKVDWVMIDPFLTPSEQREWIQMLNEGDRNKFKQWMYKEFLNMREPYPEPGLLRTRLTSLLAQVRRFMKSFYLDEGLLEARYHQIFETILYNPILYRIVQEFLLFLYEVLDRAATHEEHPRTDVVEQGIQYIEEHFNNPGLNLGDVANHVDRSPAYFSSLLTKKRGISFRQLLTKNRIKKAECLLLETKLSIQDVAEQTGFINANYFSKIFKEQTGITPRSFRDRKKV